MRRLQKIFAAIQAIRQPPASKIIREAWDAASKELFAIREGDRAFSDAIDLIGKVIAAVVAIAEDQEKAAASKGEAS